MLVCKPIAVYSLARDGSSYWGQGCAYRSTGRDVTIYWSRWSCIFFVRLWALCWDAGCRGNSHRKRALWLLSAWTLSVLRLESLLRKKDSMTSRHCKSYRVLPSWAFARWHDPVVLVLTCYKGSTSCSAFWFISDFYFTNWCPLKVTFMTIIYLLIQPRCHNKSSGMVLLEHV